MQRRSPRSTSSRRAIVATYHVARAMPAPERFVGMPCSVRGGVDHPHHLVPREELRPCHVGRHVGW